MREEMGLKMLGMKDLKPWIEKTDTTVECPVKGCSVKVERQRTVFRREERFKCLAHNIYISPSTFEYQNESENLLWNDIADMELLKKIKAVKRESRIARDNSEDALTWNVFRFLEKNNLVQDFLQTVLGLKDTEAEIIYWSYSRSHGGTWNPLRKAREEFELVPSRGSEPDLFILGNKTLTIIEAKFGATNKTPVTKLYVEDKYVSKDGNWWDKVFNSDFKTAAVQSKKYELCRFWLLGTWISKRMNLDFNLINLTLSRQDGDIEDAFKKHIKEDKSRQFRRITWEQIFEYISNCDASEGEKQLVKDYFLNKSRGYDGNGNLARGFGTD